MFPMFFCKFYFFYLFKKFAKFEKKDHQFSVLFLNRNIADSDNAGILYLGVVHKVAAILWHSQNGIFVFLHFYSFLCFLDCPFFHKPFYEFIYIKLYIIAQHSGYKGQKVALVIRGPFIRGFAYSWPNLQYFLRTYLPNLACYWTPFSRIQ